MRQGRLTQPAQSQAGNGDAQLRGGNHAVRVLNGLLHGFCTAMAAGYHFCHPRAPHADQGKLRRHEESIRQDQQDHQD